MKRMSIPANAENSPCMPADRAAISQPAQASMPHDAQYQDALINIFEALAESRELRQMDLVRADSFRRAKLLNHETQLGLYAYEL